MIESAASDDVELYDANLWESRNGQGRVLYEARTTTRHAPCNARRSRYAPLNEPRTEGANGFTVEDCIKMLEWFVSHQTGKPCRARRITFRIGAERSLRDKLALIDEAEASGQITVDYAAELRAYWPALYAQGGQE